MAGHFSREVAHGLLGCFQLLLHGSRMRKQGLAGFSQGDIAPDAVKQITAQLLFEQGDTLADRGLGEVQLLGSYRKCAVLCYTYAGFQVLGVQLGFPSGMQ